MLTVMATGAATIAGTYGGTSAQLRSDMQALEQAAPIVAQLQRPPTWTTEAEVPPPLAPELADRNSLALVWETDSARIGDQELAVVAAVPDELHELAFVPSRASVIPASFLENPDEAFEATGVVLPDRAEHITVTATAELSIDQWGIEHMNLAPGLDRRLALAFGESAETAEQRATGTAEGVAQASGSPAALEIDLYLRDLATGAGQFVSLGSRELSGPEITYDAETLSDFAATTSTTTLEWELILDPGRRFAVDAISVGLPSFEPSVHSQNRQVDLTLSLHTDDGSEILGEPTRSWASAHAASWEDAEPLLLERDAMTAEVEAEIEIDGHGVGTSYRSNEPWLRSVLDTRESVWRILAKENSLEFWGTPISAAYISAEPEFAGSVGAGPLREIFVPVALTPAAADAAALSPGDEFEMLFMNQYLPAHYVETIDAAPGRTEPLAAFIDIRRVAATFAASGQEARFPTQLWVRPDGDPAASAEELHLTGGIAAVRVAQLENPTDPTRSARLVFWVACVGAILLAGSGIAAAAATMTAHRRSEVAVLRAMGMTPSRQAASRAAELGVVVAGSVVLGLTSGWLISRFVVPALAQSTHARGLVELNPSLSLQIGPWLALLAFGAVLVLGVVVLIARTVRTQALDRTYREEVR